MGKPDTHRERTIKNMIRSAVEPLRGKLAGYRVFLFGSRATGTARERSDFDVGILGDKPLPRSAFFALQDSLEDIRTLHVIELVDFTRMSSAFKREALRHTETLYEG